MVNAQRHGGALMQAIHTKFIGPTNHRPARIKAWAQAGSVTVSWDDALGIEENHSAAVKAFLTKWEWPGSWALGASADGAGYVAVSVGRSMMVTL